MTHIPYKGAVPAFTGLLGGEIAIYMSSIPPALPMINAGRVRALGVTSAKRMPTLPERADDRRKRAAGLRGDELVRRDGAGRRAEGHPRASSTPTSCKVLKQPDVQQRFAGEGGDVDAEHAGAVRGVHPERDREVGQGRTESGAKVD